MRQITKQAINAFMNFKAFKSANTEVHIQELPTGGKIASLYLHNNKIAGRNIAGQTFINNCGWFSNTTKERLNGIPGVSICQKKGIWYLNGQQWDGKSIEIQTNHN